MSDRDNWLRPLGEAIAQGVREHVHAPPLRQNQNRAIWGTWLIVAGAYAVHDFLVRYHVDAGKLAAAFAHDPRRTATAVGTPFLIWCGMILFGCLWVAVGVPNARGGARDEMEIFWSAGGAGGCGYALAYDAYLDGLPTANWYLKGFYLATLASSLMGLFLFARGPGGSALRQMTKAIAAKNAPMVPARRGRPWWKFW